MSKVLDYVRSKVPELVSVSDDDLTLYIADRKPEFLKDPDFQDSVARAKVKDIVPGVKPSIGPDTLLPEKPKPPMPTLEEANRLPSATQTIPVEFGFPGPQLPKVPQQKGIVPQVGAGMANVAIGLAEFMLQPENAPYALMPYSSAARAAIVPGMVKDIITSAPQQAKKAWDSVKSGDYQTATVELGNLGLEAYLAKHFAKAGPNPAAPLYRDPKSIVNEASIRALRIKDTAGAVQEPLKKGEPNAIEERKVQASVQPERVRTEAQRKADEASASDSVQPEAKEPEAKPPGQAEGEVLLTPEPAKASETPPAPMGIGRMMTDLYKGVGQSINDYMRSATREEVQSKYKLATDLLNEIQGEIESRKKLGENEKELFPLRYDVDGFRAVLEHKLMTEKPPAPKPPEPTAETPAAGFKTSKGSTYAINPDQTTTRNKSIHPEHPGDVGMQPKSDITFYVDDQDLQALNVVQAQGERLRIAKLKDGRYGVQYASGKDADKFIPDSIVTPKDKPAVGLYPVEIWKGSDKPHFGNKITEVYSETPATAETSAKPAAPPEAAPEAKPVDATAETPAKQVGGEGAGPGTPHISEIPETGVAGEQYGISQAMREVRAKAGQVGMVEPGEGISAAESVAKGHELLKNGYDVEKALSDFEKTGKASDDDIAAMRAKGEQLAFEARRIEEQHGTESRQYSEAWQRLTDWDTRTKPLATLAHKMMVAHQGLTDIDTGTFTGLRRAYKNITGEDFTPEQASVARRMVKKVNDAEASTKQAVFNVLRDWAIERAKMENKARSAEVVRQNEIRKIQTEAAKKAAQTADKVARDAAVKAAEMETKAREAKAGREKEIAKVQLKAAQQARDAADLRARKAAVKAAQIAEKNLEDPAGQVWDKAKIYVESGMDDFKAIRDKIATDLGISADKVSKLMAKDKRTKYLMDEAWKSQQTLRNLRTDAKRWVNKVGDDKFKAAMAKVPRILFGIKVGFHGTVALGTHAPMVAFQPRFWKTYVENYYKMWKMVLSPAYYESQIHLLPTRKNYITANRAGLVNDPHVYEDFNSPDTVKYIGRLSGMGNRGYTVLKTLRQDMFDQMWDRLPRSAQNKFTAAAIADQVNHATGVVKKSAPKGAALALFAPRLEASRVMWLAGDPIKAVDIMRRWNRALPEEKLFASNVIKERLWVIGTGMSLLALNQGFLSAIGSNQKINGIPESMGGQGFDPMADDFLKFKVAGVKVSYGNAMLTMARLPLRILTGVANEGKFSKLHYEDENTWNTIGKYMRSQASPFASITLDLLLGRDFQEKPLPRAGFGLYEGKTNLPKRLKAQGVEPYSWAEWALEAFSPIPFQEAVKEVWGSGLGASPEQIKQMLKAFVTTLFMGGTGGRMSDDLETQ
jgi:hypothetical protein